MQMGKGSMHNRKPMILVLAGPNCSGKSTITSFFDKVGKYTNADDVVATIGMNNMEAAVMVDRMIWQKFYRKCVPPMCWSLPPPSISTKCLDR